MAKRRSGDEVEAAVAEDLAAITLFILMHCGLYFSVKHK